MGNQARPSTRTVPLATPKATRCQFPVVRGNTNETQNKNSP